MILPSFPFRVEFEVTTWCNLDCVYCYAKPFTNLFPPIEKIKHLMKKTKAEASPFEVVVVGGEPFGRKDIIDLLEFGHNLFGDQFGVSTNGTLLSGLSTDKLERIQRLYGSHREGTGLQVSFDSMKPEINNRTRGMTKETLEGLNTLQKHGINFSVGIIPTKINGHDVIETVKHLLVNYTCLKALNLEPLQPTFMTGAKGYDELRIDHALNVKINHGVSQLIKDLNRSDVKVVGPIDCSALRGEVPLIDSYQFKTCTAGLLRAAVFVNGDVTPCTMLRSVSIGNLHRESWEEIWSKSKKRFLGLDYYGGQCSNINIEPQEPAVC